MCENFLLLLVLYQSHWFKDRETFYTTPKACVVDELNVVITMIYLIYTVLYGYGNERDCMVQGWFTPDSENPQR